jgi:hypothetical protein
VLSASPLWAGEISPKAEVFSFELRKTAKNPKYQITNPKQISNSNASMFKTQGNHRLKFAVLFIGACL